MHVIRTERDRERFHKLVDETPTPFLATLKRGGTRSLSQNAFLFGVCYPTILREGGEALAGWSKEDLNDFFLQDCFGHEVIEGFGRKRTKALRRSSSLSKAEFSDYVAHIQQFCAERLGIFIPEPE